MDSIYRLYGAQCNENAVNVGGKNELPPLANSASCMNN